MDTTIDVIVDDPAALPQPRQCFHISSSPSSPQDSESISHEENECQMSTVDWRWASRKGFWNPRRRCWNEEKGGMTGYLAQREKKICQHLGRKTKKVDIQTKMKKTAISKGGKIALHRMSQAHRTPKIRWHSIHLSQISMMSSPNRDSASFRKDNIHESQLLDIMIHHGLGHTVARRFWTYGYRPESVARIFHELPHNVLCKIRQAVESLQAFFDANTQRILASDPSSNDASCSTIPNNPTNICEGLDSVIQVEVDLLEEDDINGVVQVEFDPCTQQRKSVVVNMRAAHLMNLGKEGLVQLFDNHQVPLLMTDVDALRVLLVDLHCIFRDCTVHYLRRIVHKGTEVVGMLVCRTRVHVFSKAGQISKVRDCVRVVTASEYDYALHNLADACPLATMGDRRTGQELLDSAHADAQQTIWHLAHSKQGRKVLDQLIACTERLRLSLDHQRLVAQEGWYDSKFAYHYRQESTIPATQEYPDDENGDLWSIFTSFRFWNVGYQTSVLQNLFNSVPHRLASAIKKVSMLLKITHQQVVHHRSNLSSGRLPTSSTHIATKLQSWMEEEAVWDEEQARSYLRFEWCPTTNLRKYISLNHRCADCFNMTKDEVLTRIAHHNLPLISTEMDMLRSFLFSLFHEFDDEVVEYTRRMVIVDGHVRPSLVCIRSKQIFNAWGQVYETKHSSDVVTPSEYDAALKYTPWACSLAVMGDRRSGSKLLSCAQSDARKTVASLAATRRGRSALAKMARAVDRFVVGPDARLWDLKGTSHL